MSDWSSDVCSSELSRQLAQAITHFALQAIGRQTDSQATLQRRKGFNRYVHGHSCHPATTADTKNPRRPVSRPIRTTVVRKKRLELSRVAPLEPKSSASTSSATFALPRDHITGKVGGP